MPWGNHVEPTWACMAGSRPELASRVPVDEYPNDVGPYGVRGMAGNVRDWCANVWRHDGPTVEGAVVLPDVADLEDPAQRAARGGAWMNTHVLCRLAVRYAGSPRDYFGGLGFRLVRQG